jgi:hypothetical protein
MRFALTLIVYFTAFSIGQGQDSKPPSKPAKDAKEAADKMISTGTVTGKLLNWDSKKEKDKITLEVSVDVADAGAMRNLEQLQLQLSQVNANTQLRLADRVSQAANINRQIAQAQAKLSKPEKHKVDLQLGNDLVIRRAELPTKTENGKVKKYTDKEKKELKGPNSKLPGYTASEEDLRSDLLVTAYLSKKKESKGTSKDKSDAPPPSVTMILIQKETKEPSK